MALARSSVHWTTTGPRASCPGAGFETVMVTDGPAATAGNTGQQLLPAATHGRHLFVTGHMCHLHDGSCSRLLLLWIPIGLCFHSSFSLPPSAFVPPAASPIPAPHSPAPVALEHAQYTPVKQALATRIRHPRKPETIDIALPVQGMLLIRTETKSPV